MTRTLNKKLRAELEEFVNRCDRQKSSKKGPSINDRIYDIWEDEVSKELRDALLSLEDPNTNEPVRSILNRIGEEFHSINLIGY